MTGTFIPDDVMREALVMKRKARAFDWLFSDDCGSPLDDLDAASLEALQTCEALMTIEATK